MTTSEPDPRIQKFVSEARRVFGSAITVTGRERGGVGSDSVSAPDPGSTATGEQRSF